MIEFAKTFPPQGYRRFRASIVIYYANKVDADAMEYILSNSVPSQKPGQITFLALQDGTCSSSFLEKKISGWSESLYPDAQYWAGLLTGRMPRPYPDKPPRRSLILWFNDVFEYLLIAYLVYYSEGMVKLLALTPLMFHVVSIIVWLKERQFYLSSNFCNKGEQELL
jgi:hypothetical protein